MEAKTILVLYKDNSKFYKASGKDAIILNYLFDYKIINNKVGFPDNVIDNVLNKLNENEISYQIVYVDKNPLIKDFANNRYCEILEFAMNKQRKSELINEIITYLNGYSVSELEELLKKIK